MDRANDAPPVAAPDPDGLRDVQHVYWHPVYDDNDVAIVPKFNGDGTSPPPQYLERINSFLFDLNINDQEERARVAVSGLTGLAAEWAQGREWTTYASFKKDFLKKFWSRQIQRQIQADIEYGRWHESQGSMADHWAQLTDLAEYMDDQYEEETLFPLLWRHFPPEVARGLRAAKCDRCSHDRSGYRFLVAWEETPGPLDFGVHPESASREA